MRSISTHFKVDADCIHNIALFSVLTIQLESEVTSLKKRLDGLRKAKNTTVLKKEKEYVSVGASDSNRTSKR